MNTAGIEFGIVPKVTGLSEAETETLRSLVTAWRQKRTRNLLRANYYDSKNRIKDLGISIPPQLRGVEAAVGWPAKAVDVLAARSILDGFVTTNGSNARLDEIISTNSFKQLYQQAVPAELTHSCAFITVSKGDVFEPEAVISVYSALTASAIWSYRKKRIGAGFAVVDVDAKDKINAFNIYLDDQTIECSLEGKKWCVHRVPHSLMRPLMEPLRYRPSLDRPFGKSRITRMVMWLTDCALRSGVRTEISAELYTAPQRYLLGASEDELNRIMDERWRAYIGNIFGVVADEEGNLPQFGQLPQMSMQPHLDYMRFLASFFAGITSVPLSSMGIIHDNPVSADAIKAAREDLIIEAEALNDTNGAALRTVAKLALCIAQNKLPSELDEDERSIMPRFRAADRPSVVSVSDAMVKQASVAPWLADTTVFLESLGYNEEQILRLQSERDIKAAEKMIVERIFGNESAK